MQIYSLNNHSTGFNQDFKMLTQGKACCEKQYKICNKVKIDLIYWTELKASTKGRRLCRKHKIHDTKSKKNKSDY